MTERYKSVIWDWNGTLLDDAGYCVGITNQLLVRRELPPVDLPRYLDIFGFPLRDYCHQLGFDLEADTFEQLSAEFMELYEAERSTCALRAGAVEVLTRLQNTGVEQAILSAYRQQTLGELVEHFELTGFFAYVVGVDNDFAEGKVELGARWIEAAGWSRQEAVLVGDTDHDLAVARAMGVDCVLVAGGHQSRRRLKQCGVEVVAGLGEFFDLVQGKGGSS